MIKLNKLLNDDNGAALVLVALCMLVLIGFGAIIADAGLLYKTKRDMVASADACALAVAQEMADYMTDSKGSNPLTEDGARDFLLEHNNYKMRADSVEINFVTIQLPDPDNEGAFKDFQAVKADVVRNEKYFFGKAISASDSSDVRATATAVWGYPTKIAGGNILPLFVQDIDFEPSSDIYLHNDETLPGGHWGFMSVYKENKESLLRAGLQGGFDLDLRVPLVVGESVDKATGMGNKVDFPVSGIAQSAIDTEKDGRIERTEAGLTEMSGMVPIVKEITKGGMTYLEFVGFAYYLITDVVTDKPSKGKGPNGGPYYNQNGDGNYCDKGTIIGEFSTGILDIDVIAGDQDQSHNFGLTYIKLTD